MRIRANTANKLSQSSELPLIERPAITTNLCLFGVKENKLCVLLVKPNKWPSEEIRSLPNSFIYEKEGLKEAAYRVLTEATGLTLKSVELIQVGAFEAPLQDPSMRVISVAWVAAVRPAVTEFAGNRDSWVAVGELPSLALDHHNHILSVAIGKLQRNLLQGPLFELVPETFTLQELMAVWTAVYGKPPVLSSFRRMFLSWQEEGLIKLAPGRRTTATKPSQVWRRVL